MWLLKTPWKPPEPGGLIQWLLISGSVPLLSEAAICSQNTEPRYLSTKSLMPTLAPASCARNTGCCWNSCLPWGCGNEGWIAVTTLRTEIVIYQPSSMLEISSIQNRFQSSKVFTSVSASTIAAWIERWISGAFYSAISPGIKLTSCFEKSLKFGFLWYILMIRLMQCIIENTTDCVSVVELMCPR